MNLFKKYKTFDEILPSFLTEKEVQIKHKAFIGYRGQTTVFSNWLKENKLNEHSLRRITKENIADFFIYLAKDRSLDRPTCQKYFITVRAVFQYAQKRDEVDIIPFDLVVFPPKGKDCSAQVIQPEILKELLLDIKENDEQLFVGCMLQYYCCLRPGNELRLIKNGDFDLDKGTVKVIREHAKNGRQRIVTMSKEIIEICRHYGIGVGDLNLYVFGKSRKMGYIPICANNLPHRFNFYRDSHGVSKGVKFYSFKHTGATMLHLAQVVPLLDIMYHLGHSRLSATEHYIKKRCSTINREIQEHYPNPL